MKKIIFNCNDCFAAYTFRLDLIKKLQVKYDVYVVATFDNYTQLLKDEKVKVILIESECTSTNPLKDMKIIRSYKKIFKEIEPNIIINYTVKPHIYGALAASKKTKVINVVSGVGSVFSNQNMLFQFVKCLYRVTSKKVDHYIFLNKEDYEEFNELKIIKQTHSFLNSEGVNLEKFYPYVDLSKPTTFIFIGRLVKEKGIIEYLEAAEIVKRKYPKVKFLIAGSFYKKKSAIDREYIKSYEARNIVKYIGHRYDINEVLRDVHCVVLPSYREGKPISLIEALASKKVIIAANSIGCKDIVEDGYNGFLVAVKSSYDLVFKMEKYIEHTNKEELHNNALKSSKQYDKSLVIRKMIDIIEGL